MSDPLHSPHAPAFADDGVLVRFPPGLGLVPPRDVPRTPRPRTRAEWAA